MGGRVNKHRCRFFVSKHKLHKNKWVVEKNLDNNIRVTINRDNEIEQQIPQLKCNNGELALGVAISPVGNMDDEVRYLRSKTEKWADLVRTGHIRHNEAWIGLNMTIMKTIEYALPATTMNHKSSLLCNQ
jgi:hypothetical protein